MTSAEERLDIAIKKADDDFFDRIAEEFPEVKSGDVGPDWVADRERRNREAVTSWIVGNAPRPVPGKKYRTKQYVERYPFFVLAEGEVGVAQDYEDTDDIYIKMERYLGDDAIQWKNCVVYHGVQMVDFFHDFEEVPGQEAVPEETYVEGDLVIFDDGIACPTRGQVVRAAEAPGHYVVEFSRELNKLMADRDPTFPSEQVEVDLTRADVKPASHLTNDQFDRLVREYWAD